MDEVGPVVLGDRYAKLGGAEAWAAFLFASYLFGHLVFLLGSWLDEFYDRARRYTLNTQIALLNAARHEEPATGGVQGPGLAFIRTNLRGKESYR